MWVLVWWLKGLFDASLSLGRGVRRALSLARQGRGDCVVGATSGVTGYLDAGYVYHEVNAVSV